MTKKVTVSNNERVKEIYSNLKSDLTLCIKYHRRNKPELVKEYFGTDVRNEIQQQLDVICKPFSYVQMVQIGKVISDLHTFYILPTDEWSTELSQSLSQKGTSLDEKTTLEA